jgi:formyl-CoA transferase
MPHLRDRGLLQPATVPGAAQPVSLINAGFVADRDSPRLQGPLPELGQHTEEVLRELGYPEAEICQLREQHVV